MRRQSECVKEESVMRGLILAVAVSASFAGAAQAERYYSRTVCRSAQEDADYMARTGIFAHRSSCCREGIGMGSTPEEALRRCCYNDGRYVIRERAVSRGANGRYYAVIRYHN